MKLNKWKLFDMLGYKVTHGEVRRFHDSEAKIRVCCAPRRTTKSYSAAKEVLATVLMPNKRVWVVGPSYALAEKEFRYIHQDFVINREKLGLPKPIINMNNPQSGKLFIKFPWGTVVEGKSADRPDGLLGDQVDAVIYSEAAQMPRAIRERYVGPTLNTTNGYEIIPTTPCQGAEWVHELWMKGMEGDPDIDSFSWDVRANPTYNMEEYERAKRLYGEDSPVFREQYLGEWVFYAGSVYPSFDANLHVIEPFDVPPDWPRFRAIDFGLRDPFVTLWFAVGPHAELYLYREYYNRAGMPLKHHISFIKEYSKDEKIGLTVGDPSEAQAISDMCYEGLPVISANNDRTAGRMRVADYLLPTPDGPAPYPIQNTPLALGRSKWPRLYIFNTCRDTTREFRYYRWKEGSGKEGDREKTEGDDHCLHPDTLVLTDVGPTPIHSLVGKAGRVLTTKGRYLPFHSARITKRNEPIMELSFDDGSRVKCTKDHLFMTEKGWIKAIDMGGLSCYNAVSYSIGRSMLWTLRSSLARFKNLMDIGITSAVNTFRGMVSDCIEKLGSSIGVRYGNPITSTTLTGIDAITTYPIWPKYLNRNTFQTIQRGMEGSYPTSRYCAPQSGTNQNLEESGIGNTMSGIRTYFIGESKRNVLYADGITYPRRVDFVPMPANQNQGDGLELITSNDSVSNARSRSYAIDTTEKKHAQRYAQLRVLCVSDAGRSDVYCLAVPKTHAFAIAAGQLVHNSQDCLRYGVMTRPAPFYGTPKENRNSFASWMKWMKNKKQQETFIGV